LTRWMLHHSRALRIPGTRTIPDLIHLHSAAGTMPLVPPRTTRMLMVVLK
jgi:hypothetical protein